MPLTALPEPAKLLPVLPGTAADPGHDAIIVAKISEFTGAHLYLCHTCHAIDISASHVN
jgi:hypothetical protein